MFISHFPTPFNRHIHFHSTFGQTCVRSDPVTIIQCNNQASQLARATVETSRKARRESRRGQEKAAKEKAVRRYNCVKCLSSRLEVAHCKDFKCATLFVVVIVFLSRMILAELERQERGFLDVMRTLVQDYLHPLRQADPPIISHDMVFFNQINITYC